jgi:hypothetical protein
MGDYTDITSTQLLDEYLHYTNESMRLEKEMENEFPVNIGNAHKKYECDIILKFIKDVLVKVDKKLN